MSRTGPEGLARRLARRDGHTLPVPVWHRWALAASRTAPRWWPEEHLRRSTAEAPAAVPAVQRYALQAGRQVPREDLLTDHEPRPAPAEGP